MIKNRVITNKEINKMITIVLSFIIFVVPAVLIPSTILKSNYYLIKLILLTLGGIFLFSFLVIKIKQLKFDKIDIIVLIFYTLVVLSTIFSIDKKMSIIGVVNRYEGLIAVTVYILIYYCSKHCFEKYKWFLKVFLIISTGISIYAIMQYYNIRPVYDLFKIKYTRNYSPGTFGNSNFMGSFISIILPITLALYMLKGKNKYLIISLINFTAMLCCQARSCWLAFGICCLIGFIYCIYKKDKYLFKRMAILVICFIFIFMLVDISKNHKLTNKAKTLVSDVKNTYNSIEKDEDIDKNVGSGRIEIWKMTLEVIKDHPITGCGVDALKSAMFNEQIQIHNIWMIRTKTYIDKAHNEYLQIAATEGIPALIIYLSFVTIIFVQNLKNMFKSNKSLIFGLIIASYLTQAFFNISTIGVAPLFWFVLGLSQNIKFREETKNETFV